MLVFPFVPGVAAEVSVSLVPRGKAGIREALRGSIRYLGIEDLETLVREAFL